MTESELIEACLRNDRIAQRTLYDRYKRAMYTLAYRTTSDFDEANDVLQDAFLDVFRKLDTFKGESTAKNTAYFGHDVAVHDGILAGDAPSGYQEH